MSLVSKRFLSSQGRVQELWRTCFPFPRSHTPSTAGTIIGSRPVGAALSSAETFPLATTGSTFAFLSPQGTSFRAFSSLPSSNDEHNKDRTTQATGQVDKNSFRTISHGWGLRDLSPLKTTLVKSGLPASSGNNFNFSKKLHQGHVDGPREFPMAIRYLNNAFLLPFMIVYNKISSVFLLNLSLLWHISHGMGEIMADYVHQQMTRNLMLLLMKLFLLIAMKDAFLSLVF